jgi:hypothetical protein
VFPTVTVSCSYVVEEMLNGSDAVSACGKSRGHGFDVYAQRNPPRPHATGLAYAEKKHGLHRDGEHS